MQMIKLRDEEQAELEGFIRRGKANARNIARAHILLKSAEGWSIEQLATTYGVSQAPVSNVRARYRAGGTERVLKDKVQQNRRRALGGAQEAVLVALACSPVPDGHDHWTVRMLQNKLVELGVVDQLGYVTVHRLLKKMNLNPGNVSSGAYRRK
jgi:transposase